MPQDQKTPSKPETAEELEQQALGALNSYTAAMKARTEAAFEKTDQIRIFSEGLIAGTTLYPTIISKLIRAAELRFKSLFQDATSAAEAHRKAAEAKLRADVAAASKTLAEEARQVGKSMVAADRRLRGWRAYGLAGIATIMVFGTGMLAEHWRAGFYRTEATATEAAAANFRAEMQTLTTAARAQREDIADAGKTLRDTLNDVGPGLSVLRVMGRLPDAERNALNQILGELSASVRATGPSPQLAALRQMMAVKGEQRTQALEFAQLGDAGLRTNLLSIGQMAAARNLAPWWTGESIYKGCLANGPVLVSDNGYRQATCLVPLPENWAVRTDDSLRRWYYSVFRAQ